MKKLFIFAIFYLSCPGSNTKTASDIKEFSSITICGKTPQEGAAKYDGDCKGIIDCKVINVKCGCGCILCGNERCVQWTCNTDCSDLSNQDAYDATSTDTSGTQKLCGITVDPNAEKYDGDCVDNKDKGCAKKQSPKCACGCQVCYNDKCIRMECNQCGESTLDAQEVVDSTVSEDKSENEDATNTQDTVKDIIKKDYVKDTCPSQVKNPPQMGKPCITDEECGGCPFFCYKDPFMGGESICSRECLGDCGDGFECVLFSQKLLDTCGGEHLNICMPACGSDKDCEEFASFFVCSGKKMPSFCEQTVGPSGICYVPLSE